MRISLPKKRNFDLEVKCSFSWKVTVTSWTIQLWRSFTHMVQYDRIIILIPVLNPKGQRSASCSIIIFCRNTLLAILKLSTQEQKGTHCDHILSDTELVTLIFGAHQWNYFKFPLYEHRFGSDGWAGDHIPHGWEQQARVWPVALCHMSPPPLSCQSSEHLSNKTEKSQI